MPAVAMGKTTPAVTQGTVHVPAMLPPGRYFVLVSANADHAFAEDSTANNFGASVASLLVGPDLIVTAASTAPGAAPGTNIPVHYTLNNKGDHPPGPLTPGS